MAALLEDSDLLVRLPGGDLASNEVYYHDHCYFRFRNRYNRKIKHNQKDIHEKNSETFKDNIPSKINRILTFN